MGIVTTIDKENNIRFHKVTGTPEKNQVLEMLAEIYSSTEVEPDMHVLWDFSFADLTTLSLDETDEIADFVIKHRKVSVKLKSAVVAPEVLSRYFANKITQKLSKHLSTEIRIFNQKEDALLWLKLSSDSLSSTVKRKTTV